MSRSLFRKEALDAQRDKLLGEISIARPVPLWMFTLVAIGIAALVIAVGLWGQYTRRERVTGFLSADAGAAQLMISDAGVVAELMVKEGDQVEANAPIARIAVDRANRSGQSRAETVLRELETRRKLLESESSQAASLGRTQAEQLRKRMADLRNEITQLNGEIRLQEQRLASAREASERYQGLVKEKFVSENAARQKRDEVTDQQIKIQGLMRQRAALEKELATARLDIPATEIRTRTQIEQLKRQISELQQTAAAEETRKETLVRAPMAGTVTNIGLTRGQTVAADTPFAMLLPKGTQLQAELLVPTRGIGFIHTGQQVVLRYEAFPYERFGQFKGTVAAVGKTVWTQGERIGPMAVKEPAYRVVVRLEQQSVRAGEQDFPLSAGMLLSADLLLETRSLLEWMFEPVLQLKQRLS